MSRWEPDARERLERAALELFLEQGFAQTSVPQITARAGLTTRTFFRHFADKREVLYADDEEVPAMVARMMAEAPPDAEPLALIVEGLQTVAETRFEPRKAALLARRELVRSDTGLQERDLRKRASMSAAIQEGFRSRGFDELTATLAARTAVTVLNVSIDRWLSQDDGPPLTDLVTETLAVLRALLAGP